MSFRIRIAKENCKFSCSHFTIFDATHAETLHGHNYYVSVELKLQGVDPTLGMAFDFNLVKPVIRALTNELDEKVLIPTTSVHLKVEPSKTQIDVTFGEKKYSFPKDDVLLLPLVNITSEELAKYLAEKFVLKLKALPQEALKKITAVSVGIEETRGQTVFFDLDF